MSNTNTQVLCPVYLCNRKKVPSNLVKYKHYNSSTNVVQLSAKMRYAISIRNSSNNRLLLCNNQENANINMNINSQRYQQKQTYGIGEQITTQICSINQTYKQTNTKFVPATKFLCIKYI